MTDVRRWVGAARDRLVGTARDRLSTIVARDFLITAALIVIPSAAFADLPCREVGNSVTCSRRAFDTLVNELQDSEAELDRRQARLTTASRENLDLRLALSGCLSDTRRKKTYPVIPMIFGIVGGGIIGASIMASGDGRLAGLVVGSAMAGTGLVVALF